jgi:hypothetical protein
METKDIKRVYDRLKKESQDELHDLAYKSLVYFESAIVEERQRVGLSSLTIEMIRVANYESARKHLHITANHLGTMKLVCEQATFSMIEMILIDWLDVYEPQKTLIENYIDNWQNKRL